MPFLYSVSLRMVVHLHMQCPVFWACSFGPDSLGSVLGFKPQSWTGACHTYRCFGIQAGYWWGVHDRLLSTCMRLLF